MLLLVVFELKPGASKAGCKGAASVIAIQKEPRHLLGSNQPSTPGTSFMGVSLRSFFGLCFGRDSRSVCLFVIVGVFSFYRLDY